MALTDIARQLKSIFEGEFGGSEFEEEVKAFKKRYGDAESIRIGEMTYIVINDEYRREEYSDVPESTSPLFYNSIQVPYAIIDTKTSSTLIDEVYSRITYMKKVYEADVSPDKEDIRKSVEGLIGDDEKINRVEIKSDGGGQNKANIYQCQLIKDTGVSASPDVYSFMLKDGNIKEISAGAMKQIRRTGKVSLMQDREELKKSRASIQEAVFNKFKKSDSVEIQYVTVKSIFEISKSFHNVFLFLNDGNEQLGIFNTAHLASENNEFEVLNSNIHVCNTCGTDIINVNDSSKINKIHINTDVLDKTFSTPEKRVYATGCEDCLEQCPVCGKWHFNYSKFVGSRNYDKVNFAPGRAFVKGLRVIEPDVNYCFCREGIEWIYDEMSEIESDADGRKEYNIMPLTKIAFINYANEKVASYEDYRKFYEKESKKRNIDNAIDENKFAKATLGKFRKYLADKFETDIQDIRVSSVERCRQCSVCGGEYYMDALGVNDEYNFRCSVCQEIVAEKKHMVTRNDGFVFMRNKFGKKDTLSKYVVTRLGNLRKLSTHVINDTDTTKA